jgi:phenol 2-monooxygenase
VFLFKGIADVISDLHKIFIDDESYNSGHGRAYEFYGVDTKEGAVAIVRPDQCTFLLF